MIWLRVVIMLGLCAGVAAAETPEPTQECNSCTARHKKLHALKAARLAAPLEPRTETTTPRAQE